MTGFFITALEVVKRKKSIVTVGLHHKRSNKGDYLCTSPGML